MNIYTWITTNLFTIDINNEDGYVVTALYNVSATDGTYTSNLNGNSCQFEVKPNDPNFIPYAELTNEIVIGWVKETIGVSGVNSIETCLDGLINSQINPPQAPQNTPLPF